MLDYRESATHVFGHEKLIVYKKGLQFVISIFALNEGISRKVIACGHLSRAADSIPINIAHASNTTSPGERISYLGHANGSALECAACLDVLAAKSILPVENASSSKHLLADIVSMLISMQKHNSTRISEAHAEYRTKNGNLFSHEDLLVYQTGLQLVAWLETLMKATVASRTDLLASLDKTTTSIVLNIAEGNGRFSGLDHARFLDIAYKATVRSASLLDLLETYCQYDLSAGYTFLRRIAAMLVSLSRHQKISSKPPP